MAGNCLGTLIPVKGHQRKDDLAYRQSFLVGIDDTRVLCTGSV